MAGASALEIAQGWGSTLCRTGFFPPVEGEEVRAEFQPFEVGLAFILFFLNLGFSVFDDYRQQFVMWD